MIRCGRVVYELCTTSVQLCEITNRYFSIRNSSPVGGAIWVDFAGVALGQVGAF